MLIDGKKIAEEIIGKLKTKPKPAKFLAAVFVGESTESESFIKQKDKAAKELGVNFKTYRFPADIKQEVLREEVAGIAADENCGGIILQLPLPEQINRNEIIKVILHHVDVDNLTGRAVVLAPAVGVVETIIQNLKFKIQNSRVAVVGLGPLVGKPISEWLEGKCTELQMLDTDDNLEVLKQADLVISGVGKAGLIKPEMLKDGALVIDFGYDLKNGKLSGDLELKANEANKLKAISYTPTPGGTGPILVAKLFENFYKLNQNNR